MRALTLFPAVLLLIRICFASGSTTRIAHLPETTVSAVKVDSSGNVFIAGSQGSTPQTQHAFIAKLLPDGSHSFYSIQFGGSKYNGVIALDIDSQGSAYVFGQTTSADFPVTAGAAQTVFSAPPGGTQCFVTKFDPQGKMTYSTLIGGESSIYPNFGGLVINAAGEAFVSAHTINGAFPSLPGTIGAPPFTQDDNNTLFVVKLNASGTAFLGAVRGLGGRLTTDDQGSLYLAGTDYGLRSIAATPGAFQMSHPQIPDACGRVGQFSPPCDYQFVAKLDGALSKIMFATYVTGSSGALPAAIFVDAQHDVILAGKTNSPDYPVTSSAFQPYYLANAPNPPPFLCSGLLYITCLYPPPASGFITRLAADGTGLLYSSYFSGSQTDLINFAALTGKGIYLSGQASSADLPGLEGVPIQCLPENFSMLLNLDGSSITAARTLSGNVQAYDPTTDTLLAWTGTDLVRLDPNPPPSPIACIVDAADMRPVSAIAPGELLSVFGAHFVNKTESAMAASSFPVTLDGVTATINGIASPILYVSPRQINLQAPYEIAGAGSATLTIDSGEFSFSATTTLPVVASNPVVFLDSGLALAALNSGRCRLSGIFSTGGPIPLAFNEDGTQNTCLTPAPAGSPVRILLGGLGVANSTVATGVVNSGKAVPLGVPVSFGETVAVGETVAESGAVAVLGAISGVWQVDVTFPKSVLGSIPLFVTVGGVPVRESRLIIWLQ
jgi:uncharacterized protein (TIGR03437 family)